MERPKVGVATILRKENKVLLGKRIGSHGANSWGFPGGHLEFGEKIEICAARELFEETSLQGKDFSISTITNDIMIDDNDHYITIFVTCDYVEGESIVCEPNKCLKREWFTRDQLPENLFLPIQNLLKQSYNPFR